MTDDERAIRGLVATWMAASQAGDVDTVLSLMSDDVIFMVPGRQPFGKAQFAAAARGMQGGRMAGVSDIRELQVFGDVAILRNFIEMTMTPGVGKPMRHTGYTLTVFRRQPDGRWLLWRDANLMTAVEQG